MITKVIPLDSTNGIILGKRGENLATEIVFPLGSLIETYGAGTAVLLAKRSLDESAYPVVATQTETDLEWVVTNVDTNYMGRGQIELFWYVGGVTLAKTIIWPTIVLEDITGVVGTAPDAYETWVDHLTDLGSETLTNALAAARSAQEAQAAQTAAETAQGKAETAQGKAEDAQRDAEIAQTAAQNAQGYAEVAQGKAEDAQGAAERAQGAAEEAARQAEEDASEIRNMSATATTLSPGSQATASYSDGVLSLGIPKGDKGDKGDTGNVMFCTFEIDPSTGILSVTYPTGYTGATFAINNYGHLEVTV